MARLRALSQDSALVILRGLATLMATTSAQIPSPPPGGQPIEERALSFPQVIAFQINEVEGKIKVRGVSVNDLEN